MEIIQLVPQLPPTINGLGDHAFLLAKQLLTGHTVRSHFIVGDPFWLDQGKLLDFKAHTITERSASSFRLAMQKLSEFSSRIVLHYVGYGYASRGCPFWLVDALEEWRRANKDRFLLTMFHELYAFGPPWRSSFWLSPLQKRLAKRLADVSDHCRTNMNIYARILEKLSPRHCGHVSVMPVFSNVGEPATVLPLEQRKRQMVVFGTPCSRRSIYTDHLPSLLKVCERLKLDEIVDIGSPAEIDLESPLKFTELGAVNANEVSAAIGCATVGILDYPTAVLGKSTIFAAYAAHGVLPINFNNDKRPNDDGIKEGEDFLSAAVTKRSDAGRFNQLTERVASWYSGHNIKTNAECLCSVLSQNPQMV
jgi:hypothetical protein